MSIVKHFGARGDGLADDAEAIQHAWRDGGGVFRFLPVGYTIVAGSRIVKSGKR